MTELRQAALDPRTVVERYLREVLTGEGPATPADLIANETLRHKVDVFRTAFRDVSVIAQQVVVDGDRVGVAVTGRGTHHGIFLGVPPTGRQWTATCTAMYRVDGGKIVDFWVNWDLLAMLEQLGGVQRSARASA